jgi:hypothetical protein
MKKLSASEAGKLGYLAGPLANMAKAKHLECVEQYNNNPKVCPCCEKLLSYELRRNQFCSHSCATSHSNKKRGFKKRVKSSSCINCGIKTKKNASKFCSHQCQFEHQWKLRKEQISLSGKVTEIRQAKKYLKEVRGNSCEMCGIDKWAGKPILLLCDHIDGNSNNWDLKNLRLICSNCDATTPFYKNKNKGNGRAYRRERYKQGKTF